MLRTNRASRCGAIGACLLGAVLVLSARGADKPLKALIVVGPSSHPPGTHEVAAGGRLVAHVLGEARGVPKMQAEVVTAWPRDPAQLDGLRTLVFIGDLFPGATLPESDKIMADLARLMDRGCGIVCLHYATGLGAKNVPADGDHPLLRWMGGYFATKCAHHQSVARVLTATVKPAEGAHPVTRGWKEFTFDDEPYFNNYFGPKGLQPPAFALATSLLPPEKPQKEVVAWGIQRPDGGRGIGIVMPHYYRNWRHDDLRTLIVNSIYWTAGVDIPERGVTTPAPDLSRFQPAAIEPAARPAKSKAKAGA